MGRLAVIAPATYHVRDPLPAEVAAFGGWTVLNWASVGDIVQRPSRRAAALPLAQRSALDQLRLDFVWMLQQKGLATMDPLRHLDIITVAREAATRDTLEDLWSRTVRALTEDGRYTGLWEWDGGGFSWAHAFARPGTEAWVSPYEGWFELLLSPDDFWAEDRVEEPAFAAGIVFDRKKARSLPDQILAPGRADWRATLRGAGFTTSADAADTHIRVYRTRYLAEMLVGGATLDQQSRGLARWVRAAFDDLATMPPAPPWPVADAELAPEPSAPPLEP